MCSDKAELSRFERATAFWCPKLTFSLSDDCTPDYSHCTGWLLLLLLLLLVAVVPYIHEVMEPIKRILCSYNVKVAQKPFLTFNHIFVKPKNPVWKEQKSDAIYSIPCNNCNQEYASDRQNVSLGHV